MFEDRSLEIVLKHFPGGVKIVHRSHIEGSYKYLFPLHIELIPCGHERSPLETIRLKRSPASRSVRSARELFQYWGSSLRRKSEGILHRICRRPFRRGT